MRKSILTIGWLAMWSSVALVAGCNAPPSTSQRLGMARSAFSAGDYHTAFVEAERATHASSPDVRGEAAYIAGLSAHRRHDMLNAERYLRMAGNSSDAALAGQALAQLGLIYGDLGWHAESARHLLAASTRLHGQDKANAYYYAAVAQQKMGQWPQARTNLTLAHNLSADPALKARAAEQLLVTGYTLQFGAFANEVNAEKEAQRRANELATARIGAARITTAPSSEHGQLYLVQAGHFTTYDSAVQARTRLGANEAVVVTLKSTGG